jgi:hypothetical protein
VREGGARGPAYVARDGRGGPEQDADEADRGRPEEKGERGQEEEGRRGASVDERGGRSGRMASTNLATARQRGMRGAYGRSEYGPRSQSAASASRNAVNATVNGHVEDAAGAGAARRGARANALATTASTLAAPTWLL